MTLTQTDKRTPGHDEVIFFTEPEYNGTGYLSTLGARVDIYKEYRPLNDKLVSAKLGDSCKVAAYWQAGFGAPVQEFTADTPNININGMSAFIITGKTGEHPVLFTFTDQLGGQRKMILRSSEFPEGGSVTQPNPDPEPGADPNTPRVFSILKDANNIDRPATVAIYVQKSDGGFEDVGAAMYVYWSGEGVQIKEVPEYGHPNLGHRLDGSTIHFEWR